MPIRKARPSSLASLALPIAKRRADHQKWKQRQRESRPLKGGEPISAPSCNYSIKLNTIREGFQRGLMGPC
ncbi:hypothetical protein GBA52_015387 [Prunus armeniaca]|nr:hypothetical protein GBA52_015387 [Prunus armeniaca]